MFEIQKNLPIPPSANSSLLRECKYPFADMQIEDAFVVPANEVEKNTVSRIRCASYSWRKRFNAETHRFTIRLMENGDVGVWRIR